MKCFCTDLTATQTVEALEMNRNTINRYYGLFRAKIYKYQTKQKSEYAGFVPDYKKTTLQKIIRGKISFNSQLITDD